MICAVCQCGEVVNAVDELAGKIVRCRKCGRPVLVPVPDSEDDTPQFKSKGLSLGARIALLLACFGLPLTCLLPRLFPIPPDTLVTPTVGSESTLFMNGAPECLVAPEYTAYEEFQRLAIAKDKEGIQAMVEDGRLLLVPAETKVRIIETGFEKYRVRILNGKYARRDGWVMSPVVRKVPAGSQ